MRGRVHGWIVSVCALGAVAACNGSSQTSSESHWVTCATNADCQPLDPLATCVATYCEAADGTRLVQDVSAGGAGGSPAIGGAPGGGASTEGGASSGATASAGASPAEAGNGATSAGAAGMSGGGGASPGGSSAGGAAGTGVGGEPSCDALPEPLPSAQVFEGDYLLTDAASLAAAQGLTEITGSLTLGARSADALVDIALPALEALGGDLSAQSSNVVSFELPNLRAITGNLNLRVNAKLESVDLRQLEQVTGAVGIAGNAALERLRLDSLTSVGSFDVAGDALPGCEVDALRERLLLDAAAVGRTDCECSELCGWLEAACP